jgi:hypothetical protein
MPYSHTDELRSLRCKQREVLGPASSYEALRLLQQDLPQSFGRDDKERPGRAAPIEKREGLTEQLAEQCFCAYLASTLSSSGFLI